MHTQCRGMWQLRGVPSEAFVCFIYCNTLVVFKCRYFCHDLDLVRYVVTVWGLSCTSIVIVSEVISGGKEGLGTFHRSMREFMCGGVKYL